MQLINSRLAVVLLGMLAIIANADVLAQSPPQVPPGTEVTVKIVEGMSSKTAKTGQKFAVEVVADVVVDGHVAIPAGTRGSGTVIFARAKRSVGGGPGALDVRIDHVDAPGGQVRLKSSDAHRGQDRRKGAFAAQMAFGLLGALAVQGSDIDVPAGFVVHAVVAPNRPALAAVATPAVVPAAIASPTTASEPEPVATAAPAPVDAATTTPPPPESTSKENP